MQTKRNLYRPTPCHANDGSCHLTINHQQNITEPRTYLRWDWLLLQLLEYPESEIFVLWVDSAPSMFSMVVPPYLQRFHHKNSRSLERNSNIFLECPSSPPRFGETHLFLVMFDDSLFRPGRAKYWEWNCICKSAVWQSPPGSFRNVQGNVSSISASLLAAVHVPCHARLISLFSEWLWCCAPGRRGQLGLSSSDIFFFFLLNW